MAGRWLVCTVPPISNSQEMLDNPNGWYGGYILIQIRNVWYYHDGCLKIKVSLIPRDDIIIFPMKIAIWCWIYFGVPSGKLT